MMRRRMCGLLLTAAVTATLVERAGADIPLTFPPALQFLRDPLPAPVGGWNYVPGGLPNAPAQWRADLYEALLGPTACHLVSEGTWSSATFSGPVYGGRVWTSSRPGENGNRNGWRYDCMVHYLPDGIDEDGFAVDVLEVTILVDGASPTFRGPDNALGSTGIVGVFQYLYYGPPMPFAPNGSRVYPLWSTDGNGLGEPDVVLRMWPMVVID